MHVRRMFNESMCVCMYVCLLMGEIKKCMCG
jgi:hypothetical protein